MCGIKTAGRLVCEGKTGVLLDRQETDRTDELRDRWTETWRGKTSQDSPPVTVVGGNVAPTHGHTFVVVG